MQDKDFHEALRGKDEQARVEIAQRTGRSLGEDPISEADRRAAEIIAFALAEDAIERVRCELSKAIRHAKHLPRELAMALAHDVDSVSGPFLEVTEVFSDSDWQSLILTIGRGARVAIARRTSMTGTIASSLAELGDSVVIETLVDNPMAPMSAFVCNTILDRFASEPWVLDALAGRDDLLADIVVKLTTRVSVKLQDKLAATYNLQDLTAPLVEEAEIEAIVQTISKVSAEELMPVVETLQSGGKLKPILLLAVLRERKQGFLEAALAVRAERSLAHVRSVLERANLDAAKDLLGRAGIPEKMHDEFWNGIETVRQEKKS